MRFETFRSLERIFKINNILETSSPLLIRGAEKKFSVSENDMEFIRNEDGEVFIPGSSLRGFFRANLERILPALNKRACDIIRNPCSKEEEMKKKKKFDPENTHFCDVCELFGNTMIGSKILFEDAQFREGTPQFDRRVGIAINRKSQSVRHGPFTFETLIKSSRFNVSFNIRMFTITDLALTNLVLSTANSGLIRIGAFKSKGYGEIKFTWKSDTMNNSIFLFGTRKNEIIEGKGIQYDTKSKILKIPFKSWNDGDKPKCYNVMIEGDVDLKEEIPGIFEITLTPAQTEKLLKSSTKIYMKGDL
ncbi:MAG: RAMP superfamily CRISPR-associated protein [Candidatus Helarchaeota archaeon]